MSVRDITATFGMKQVVALATVALVTTAGAGSAALGVGPLGSQEATVAQQDEPLETTVSLEPSSATVANGETATYDVVVHTANGGVGAYEFTLSVDDPGVASVSDVAPEGSPDDEATVSISDDGSSADVTGELADTSDTGSVTIATVTVRGDEVGTSDVELSIDTLDTDTGDPYTVTGTTGASMTVEAADPEPDTDPEPDQDPGPTPPTFEVSNLDAPDTLTEGHVITVSADVTNEGDQAGTQVVEFRLGADGDRMKDSQEVTLDSDETQTVTFTGLATSGLAAGDHTHGFFTENDSATAEITIEDGGSSGGSNGDSTEALRETGVSLQLSNATVSAGESTAYDVVVDEADGGVGAYNLTVAVDDPSVASVAGLHFGGDPPAENRSVTMADDGSSASAEAALANTSDTGNATIATVTVDGNTAGTSALSLGVSALSTEAGEPYTVTGATNASITVEAADEGDNADTDPTHTRDEISQAKYGDDFANLSAEAAGEVQTIYNRQPFANGTDLADVRTRDEIANDRNGSDFENVSTEAAFEIQNDYDAQFGPLPSDPEYNLSEIAQAKYGWGVASGERLSTDTAGELQAIYNRQPFLNGTDPADIRTRDEIANDRYNKDFENVTRETTIEIQNDYDAQFEEDS